MRGKAYLKWLGIALALVLMLMMGTTYYAQLSKGVEAARFIVGGKDTVRLKIWASLPQGTKIEVTIGQNKITFTWTANEVKQGFLDTGHLEIKGPEAFVKILYAKTPNECRIPISQIPQGIYKAFCRLVTTAMLTPLPNPQGWHNRNVTVTLKAEGGGANLQICYRLTGASQQSLTCIPRDSVQLTIQHEGQTTLFFYAKDADLQEDEQKLEIKLDKTPPDISMRADGNYNQWFRYYITQATIRWDVSDRLSGLGNCAVEINNQLQTSCQGAQVLAIGSHRIRIFARDQADNEDRKEASLEVKPPQPAYFKVSDLSVPPISLIGKTVFASAKVQNIGDVEGEGSVWLEVDGTKVSGQEQLLRLKPGEIQPVTFQFIVRSQEHNVRIRTPHDQASRQLKAERFSVTARRSPEPNNYGWNNNDVTVEISVDGGEENLQTCYILEGATQRSDCLQGRSATVTINNEGTTKVIYFAKDQQAESSRQSLDVKIDKTKPTISLRVIEGNLNWQGAYYLGTIKIQWGAEDRVSGLGSCQVEISGQPKRTDCSGTMELKEGEHRVSINVQDRADNNASEQQTYQVRKPQPARFKISNLTITPTQPLINTPVTISAQVQNIGDLEDEQSVWLEVNNKREMEQKLKLNPGESKPVQFKYTFNAAGSYEITIRSRDHSSEPQKLTIVGYLVCTGGCQYNSIQRAINSEPSGSTILIAPETFTETVFIDKSITLQGAGIGKTVIKGAEPGLPVIMTGARREKEFAEGFESGRLGSLNTGGSAPWFVQNQVKRSGSYAAQAGKIGDNQSSWLELKVTLKRDGFILFWVKTDSEQGKDYLNFYVDGDREGYWSGENTAWYSGALKAGSHTLRWEYKKDASNSKGQDTAWVDDIEITTLLTQEQEIQVTLEGLTITGAEPLAENVQCASMREETCPDGLQVRGRANVKLREVQILENHGFGILALGTAQFETEKTVIAKNRLSGVKLEGSTRVVLRNSTISGNGSRGIFTSGDSVQLEVKDSVIQSNKGCGIWIFSDKVKVLGGNNEMGENGADLCGFAPASLRKPLQAQTEKKELRVPQDYKTVQEAIDAVAPGGTVIVAEGTYEVGLTMWKPVTLRGAGGNKTLLKAFADREFVVSVIAEAKNVQISDLKITGARSAGLLNYGQATISNATIEANVEGLRQGQGATSAELTLHNSTVAKNNAGVALFSGTSTITNSTVAKNNAGVALFSGTSTITNSTVAENNVGVVLFSGTSTITNSTIEKNINGLTIYDGRARVLSNTIKENKDFGIWASSVDNLIECRGNTVSNNGQDYNPPAYEVCVLGNVVSNPTFNIAKIQVSSSTVRINSEFNVKATVQYTVGLTPRNVRTELATTPVRLECDGCEGGSRRQEQQVALRPSWFSTGGHAPWRAQNEVKKSGNWAVQAGKISDRESSWLELRAFVPRDGYISFYVKTDTEPSDRLIFLIDGQPQEKTWSGSQDWQPAIFRVKQGWHTFRWEYKKDSFGSRGQDTVWIDDIEITDLPPQKFEDGSIGPPRFRSSGDAPWIIQGNVRYNGSYAAQAGKISNNQRSSLEFSLHIPHNTKISFRVLTDSESYDKLRFYIDGSEQGSWSGALDRGWQSVSFNVSAGLRTFRWEYQKDSSDSRGQDTAWIDDIEIAGVFSEGFESGNFGNGSEQEVTFTALKAPSYETTLRIQVTTQDDNCDREPREGRCRAQVSVGLTEASFYVWSLEMNPPAKYYEGAYLVPPDTQYIKFTAKIKNTGDREGTRRIELWVKDLLQEKEERKDRRSITFRGGEERTETFEFPFDTGFYRVEVRIVYPDDYKDRDKRGKTEAYSYKEFGVWREWVCSNRNICSYSDLQEAIRYGRDSILVFSGYFQTLEISRSVFLAGVQRGSLSARRIISTGGDVKLAYISVGGSDHGGIEINGGSLKLYQSDVRNNYAGIIVERGTSAYIGPGNLISGNTYGIDVFGYALIFRNRIENNKCGIRYSGGEVDLRDNIFSGNQQDYCR